MTVTTNISGLMSVDIPGKAVASITSSDLMSDEVRLIFQYIFYSVVSELITVFGAAANIINIACFVKLGFKDTANIGLLGLAVSDLGSLLTLIWTNICFTPGFNELVLPFIPVEVQYVTGSSPHVVFTRVTCSITAFITLERCLCVTIPLKVKTIFTRNNVTAIVVVIFLYVMGSLLPGFSVVRFVGKFSIAKNKTVIGVAFTEDRDIVEAVVFIISSCFIQMSAFIVVLVCTILLVVKLKSTTKWRIHSTTQGQAEMSIRDQKVTKMVVTISTFFIASFIPICIIMVVMILEPELSIEGRYRNVFISIFSLVFVLESTNSAVNIFIYYQMSSKYRAILLQMLTCRRL